MDTMVNGVPLLLSKRGSIAVLVFVCMVLNYALRTSLSVAIVAMVNHTAIDTQLSTNGMTVYSINNTSEDGPFVWSKVRQGHILGAFYYGYLISQVPSGLLSERYGVKVVYLLSMLLAALPTLFTPFAATRSYETLLFFRFLVGLGSGSVYPCMHVLWSNWAPPHERTVLTGFSYAGSFMGNVLSMPVSGYLCRYGFSGGWPSVFYVFGGASLCLTLVWSAVVSNSPATASCMSERERAYVTDSLRAETRDGTAATPVQMRDMPWRKIASSTPVYAILISNFTSDWGLYTMMTNMPSYFKDVLKFNIETNGMISAFPYLGLWLVMVLSSVTADLIRERHLLNTTNTRKLFNFIGQFGSAIFLVILGFLDDQRPTLAVVVLILSVSVSGSSYTGFFINHIDLAPRFAGTLLGLTNGAASITGFIVPIVVAKLTENRSREDWQKVFLISAAFYVLGSTSFCLMASGEIQEWALAKKPLNAEMSPLAFTEMDRATGEGDTRAVTT